ncbi:MAG: amidohydrolase family protein, partial [Pyrinomonadaceae bacterium]|nr:amidohydrolase family protein [Pyrinomonadaceae bacterium]
ARAVCGPNSLDQKNLVSYPNIIIDMHTHLFNARYVPLYKVFRSRKLPRVIAGPLAFFILALTQKSDLNKAVDFDIAKASGDEIEDRLDKIANVTVEQISILLAEINSSLVRKKKNVERNNILEAFENTDLHKALVEIENEIKDEEAARELRLEHLSDNEMAMFDFKKGISLAESKRLFGAIWWLVKKFLKKAKEYIENFVDFLDFLITMMRSEKSLYRRLNRYYKESKIPNYLLVHHMMDMAKPFSGKAKFKFYPKQLTRMTNLERFSQGNAIGFSAFDPIRFCRRNRGSADIIAHMKIALSHGKVGFKFYPPLGYKAAGNSGRKLETVIDIFLDECIENQIPVFTHCTPEGFEVIPNYSGANAHPNFWREALTKNAKRNNLLLCFGHAGGGERKINNKTVRGWLSDDDEWKDPNNYARHVADLCREFPNVYCEISYMTEIIHDNDEKNLFKERLIKEYSQDASSNPPFCLKDKIMYGSDWHMPEMVNDIDEFLEDIVEIYSDATLKPHAKKFFAINAVKFLNLRNFARRAAKQLNKTCSKELLRKVDLAV